MPAAPTSTAPTAGLSTADPPDPPRAGHRARRYRPGAALLLAVALLPQPLAQAQQREPEPEPDGLEQTVDPAEENAEGPAVLSVGHVDIGPRFADGEWRIQGRDDSRQPPVWRLLTDVVTEVSDAAIRSAPDDEQFAFLDAPPGSEVHVIGQTQEPEVIWLGWNTQDPEVMDRVDRGVTLTMVDAEGPGQLVVFLQDGAFGPPDVLWDSAVEGRQELWVDVNTHTHANWVFTEPGVYSVDFEISAELISGERVSDRAALRFAVGDATDVQDAFDLPAVPAPSAEPTGAPGGPAGAASGEPAATDRQDGQNSTLARSLALVGGALVLLLAAVARGTVRSRRARRQAAEDDTGPSGDIR